MKNEKLSEVFPFGQTECVGNFKLWRSRQKIKTTEGPMEIDCLNVSSLSGEWMVRIPDTYEMFGFLVELYGDYRSGDEELSRRAETYLYKVFANMMYASVVANGYYQQGIEMVAMVYANPSLLGEKGQVQDAFMEDVRRTVDNFLEWRKGYDAEVASHQPTEEEDHQESLADQAADILAN